MPGAFLPTIPIWRNELSPTNRDLWDSTAPGFLDSKNVVIKTGNKGNNCATSSDGKMGVGMELWGGTVLPPAPKNEN